MESNNTDIAALALQSAGAPASRPLKLRNHENRMSIDIDGLKLDGLGNLRAVLESSPDCVKILDLDGRLNSINEAGRIFLGLPSTDYLVGQAWVDVLPQDSRLRAVEALLQTKRGQTVRMSTSCYTPFGLRYCDLTVTPLRDLDGAVVAILAITRDVTDLVLARMEAEVREKALARKAAALRAAGLVAKLGAWEIDYAHDAIFWSDELWSLMLQTPRDIKIEEAFGFFTPDDLSMIQEAFARCRQTGRPFTFDTQVQRADGSQIWVRVFGEAAKDRSVLRGAVQDITDRRRAEGQLIAARDAAEAATRAKSAFLANMSHEIRTPLHGIIGMAQVVEREPLSDEQRSRLGVIRQSGDILMGLLNDILDLSKIEAGMLQIDERDFDLVAVLQATCAQFAFQAAQKDIGLELQIDPSANGRWRGDDLRLRQVISNLVSNAVKFTSVGGVTVTADARGGMLQMRVADTGVGMEPDNVARLFQSFTQGDSTTSRRFGGTGLGLAISRHLAQLMGGDLEVTTALGQGSSFCLRLPLARGASSFEPDEKDEEQLPERGLRILAAEDNQTNQLILRSMLSPLLAELTLVSDGDAVVEVFAQSDFNLILMDIQMPGRNGVEATRAIRQLERRHGRSPTPILALSANVMAHQIQEYEAAGMDGVVEKPIDITRLFSAIARALGPSS
jgi:PAS domain S-box-containing protein